MGHKACRGFRWLYPTEKPIPNNLEGKVYLSPPPLLDPVTKSLKVRKVSSPLKKCCSRSSQSYIYDLFFLDYCHVLACKFRTMPFFIRGVAKIEGGKNCILSFFDFLVICLDVPQKRLAKSSYKTNRILTFSLQRPSHAPTCVCRCCLLFLSQIKKMGWRDPFYEGRCYFEMCF